jgi:outer membrane protein assembly factor BamB
MPLSHRATLAGLLLAAVLCAAARSDDWPQFRRDSNRTAFSGDKIKPPLTEIWSWTTTHTLGHSPLYNVAVRQGRVYFTACEGPSRWLVCADAQTGSVLWRQPLTVPKLTAPLTDSVGPSVTANGLVVVYDEMPVVQVTSHSFAKRVEELPGPHHAIRRGNVFGTTAERHKEQAVRTLRPDLVDDFVRRQMQRAERETRKDETAARLMAALKARLGLGPPLAPAALLGIRFESRVNGALRAMADGGLYIEVGPVRTLCIRTFDAGTGQAGPHYPVRQGRFGEMFIYQLFNHPPTPHSLEMLEAPTAVASSAAPEAAGYPLLVADEVIATTAGKSLIRWRPTGGPVEASVRETLLHHPLRGVDPWANNPARLGGFPPLILPMGILVGEDTGHRFLGTVDALSQSWHRDVQTTIGVPALNGSTVYLGLGGPGASRSISAMDAGTGAPVWTYSPEGLPPDPLRIARDDTRYGRFAYHHVQADPRTLPKGADGKTVRLPSQTGVPEGFFMAGDQGYWSTWHLQSPLLPGHWTNAGLVLDENHVYGEVNGTIAALDRVKGAPKWRTPLARGAVVRSLIGAGDYLYLCVSVTPSAREPLWGPKIDRETTLIALRREDGKRVWEEKVAAPGNLAAAAGLVFFANGGLHVYGPPERTFRMAADSPNPETYRERPQAAPEQVGEDEGEPKPADQGPAAEVEGQLADATVVRATWGDTVEAVAERVRARRAVSGGAPLVLSLNRLNPFRNQWLDSASTRPFTQGWVDDYAAACGRIAAAARPDFFDVLPELNVYLARYPEVLPQARALAQAIAKAARAASPGTRVVISFNCEVASGKYGRGEYLPFGKVEPPSRTILTDSLTLAADVDAVGLTSYPQAGFLKPQDVPPDYFGSFKRTFGDRPVLVTRLGVRLDDKPAVGPAFQAGFVRRLLQNCYWLDAPVVAYPDLIAEAPDDALAPMALRVGKEARPALAVWRDVFRWKRVSRLAAAGGANSED